MGGLTITVPSPGGGAIGGGTLARSFAASLDCFRRVSAPPWAPACSSKEVLPDPLQDRLRGPAAVVFEPCQAPEQVPLGLAQRLDHRPGGRQAPARGLGGGLDRGG